MSSIVRGNTRKLTRLLMTVAALALLAIATQGFAMMESKTVITEGVGGGADKAKARDDAITDANRRAVEQVAGVLVNAETLVQNSALIKDEVLIQSEGFIKFSEVVEGSERWDDHGLFHTKVRATVLVGKVQRALESVCEELELAGNPRVIIALQPERGTSEELAEVCASTLRDKLVAEGIHVSDVDQLDAAKRRLIASLELNGDYTSTEAFELQEEADLLIKGSVSVKLLGRMIPGQETISAEATMDCWAVWTDNARIVTSKRLTQRAAAFTKDQARERAAEAVAESWIESTLCKLKIACADPAKTFRLIVTHARDAAQVESLVSALEDLRFVRDVKNRRFETGVAQLDVEYIGTDRSLRQELLTLTNPRMKIIRTTGKTITVQL